MFVENLKNLKNIKGDFIGQLALVQYGNQVVKYIYNGKDWLALNNANEAGAPINGSKPYYKSCKEIKKENPNASDGYYTIDPDGSGSIKPFKAYCDMSTTDKAFTFYYVYNGLNTNKRTDRNSCQAIGLMLFAPTSKQHYLAGARYGKKIGVSKLGPLGIYNPTNGPATRRPMNSYDEGGYGMHHYGWKSINGGNFWISSKNNIAEPNGAYTSNCWLGFDYDSNLNVTWYNDGNCGYHYVDYMCMAKDDVK